MNFKSISKDVKHIGKTIVTCFGAWSDDHATTYAAALAYYTVFSIAPLLLIALAVGGLVFGQEALHGQVADALTGLLGSGAADAIDEMLTASALSGGGGIASIVGAAVLVIGATTVFGQLQESLNVIWKVRPKPGRGIATILRQRILSFAMILVIAFLLLVSMLLTAVMASIGEFARARLPGGAILWKAIDLTASLALISFLFGAIYKILPDVKLGWRDVRFGAVLTAVLFTIGKFAIGLYLGKSAVATTFGAAGALVIILLWTYYSSAILLFGAEYTRHHSLAIGSRIEPKEDAEWSDPSAGNRFEKGVGGPTPIPLRQGLRENEKAFETRLSDR